MGNRYRFRLSDMIPNAWFYKLKDMNINNTKAKHHNTTITNTTISSRPNYPPSSSPRKSYYITRDLQPIDYHHQPPRKSSNRHTRRSSASRNSPKQLVSSSSVSAGCNCRATICTKPEPGDLLEFRSDHVLTTKSSDDLVSVCSPSQEKHILHSNSTTKSEFLADNFDGFDESFDLDLPPVITKPLKKSDETSKCRKYRGSSTTSLTQGVKLRVNSPRIAANRKIQGRKSTSGSRSSSLSGSFAIVKSSANPQKDFRDSMVEMIMENDIKGSKELEDLLACYLSLNSDEYHDLIIKVFKQIWFDLTYITK